MSEAVKVIILCLISGCLLSACDKAPTQEIQREFVDSALKDVGKINSEADAISAALWDDAYLKEMTELLGKSRAKIDEPSLKTQLERFKDLFDSNAPEVADFRFKTIKEWIKGLGGAIPDDLLKEHLDRIVTYREAFDPDGLEAERTE